MSFPQERNNAVLAASQLSIGRAAPLIIAYQNNAPYYYKDYLLRYYYYSIGSGA